MTTREQLRAIRDFSDYSDTDLDLLLTVGTHRAYAPGEELCRQGALGVDCFFVLDGVVDVVKTTAAGEKTLASITQGAVVGQLALVGRGRRTATLRAREAASCLLVGRDTYERLLAASSPLALRFQRQIAVACIRQLRGAVSRLAGALDAHAQGAAGAPEAGGESAPVSARDLVRRYIESTAEELQMSLGDLDDVVAVHDGSAPRRVGWT